MKDAKAVILAAGLGTRMKTEVPKVLHPIGSGTMLGKVIASLKKAGATDILAVVGYKAEAVESFFKGEIEFVRQEELLGSADALRCAGDYLGGFTGTVLVTCGDTPLFRSETYRALLERHTEENAACTVLTCRMDDPFSYGRIVRDDKGRVQRIVEEKDASEEEKKINEINTGTYCFDNAELQRFIKEIEINEKKKEFYLTDIVEILADNGKTVTATSCDAEEAIGINSRKDLAMANKLANKRVIEKLMDSGVTVIDPDNTYIDEDVEIGKDTVIYPNTVIESGVKIAEGCKIGPSARLRGKTTIARGAEIGNFVEICRTTVGEESKVKHLTYLGDTEVGSNVNIGAGTITANYDGKSKNRTVIEDDASIGAGAVLIAPVKIGKGATVGASSVVTKNKDVPAGTTVAGIPARPLGKK